MDLKPNTFYSNHAQLFSEHFLYPVNNLARLIHYLLQQSLELFAG